MIKAGRDTTRPSIASAENFLNPYGVLLTSSPAAADTILTHFRTTGEEASAYDLIVTGDLGALGSRILKDLCWEKGFDISANHVDCGEIIYNVIEDEFQGGSGAGFRRIRE